mmetsp:Transcript_17104/g.28407  ORF Transcript_17104/g.28407 Transcript_17104/m.28407 type:complete len:320 (+) Transcript_17104:549-1508(+)
MEDGFSTSQIRERNVNELIKTSWTNHSRIQNIWTIGSSNHKHVLASTDTINFREDLVDDTISSFTATTTSTTTSLGDRVHLVEHQNTRTGSTSLVKEFTNIGFTLSEILSQEFRTLDGDKVSTAFVGNSLGQKRLSASRWTIEKNTLTRAHSKLDVLLCVFHWVLNSLMEFTLDIFKTSNIVPMNVWYLHLVLTKRRRSNDRHGIIKVLSLHQNAIQNLLVDGILVKVNESHLSSDALKSSLHTKLLKISSDITVGVASQKIKVDICSETHVTSLNLKNLQSSHFIWNAHIEFPIETTRTTKGGFNGLRTVGSRHNDNL